MSNPTPSPSQPAGLDAPTAKVWADELLKFTPWPGLDDDAYRSTAKLTLVTMLSTLDRLMTTRRSGPAGTEPAVRALHTVDLRALITALRSEPKTWRAIFAGDQGAIEAWAEAMTLQATGKVPDGPVFSADRRGLYVGEDYQLVRFGEYVEAVIHEGTIAFRAAPPVEDR
jgi:hypothetical protein